MNTQKPTSFGELFRAAMQGESLLSRDLVAEAKEFCTQWEALVGAPTTKVGITQMMKRALVVLKVGNAQDVETVLAEVRLWLADRWLMDLDISMATATKRWEKACVVEDVILVDYI